MKTYKIVRYYHPDLGKKNRTIKGGLLLVEALAHCQDPRTMKRDRYFDGFTEEEQWVRDMRAKRDLEYRVERTGGW